MIVSCPSCQTRYRHAADPNPAVMGQCGECDDTFPMEEARRSYVLLSGVLPRPQPQTQTQPQPQPQPQTQTSIGMDDPVLADKLGVPAPDADSGPVPPAEQDLLEQDAAASSAAAALDVDSGAESERTPDAGGSGLFEILVAVAPTAACAGLAYYLADLRGLDSITWTAVGGAVGLLLGWGCLLWKRPRD